MLLFVQQLLSLLIYLLTATYLNDYSSYRLSVISFEVFQFYLLADRSLYILFVQVLYWLSVMILLISRSNIVTYLVSWMVKLTGTPVHIIRADLDYALELIRSPDPRVGQRRVHHRQILSQHVFNYYIPYTRTANYSPIFFWSTTWSAQQSAQKHGWRGSSKATSCHLCYLHISDS
jgi:hypothetical protein